MELISINCKTNGCCIAVNEDELVMQHFENPIKRNRFAAEAVHNARIKDIRMGHDDNGYWIRYKEDLRRINNV